MSHITSQSSGISPVAAGWPGHTWRGTLVTLCTAVVAMMTLAPGCATHKATPYAPVQEADRNPLKAQELTLKAADLIPDDLPYAEKLLVEALTADLYHGPAHNDLGVVYLKQGKMYEAASEFEWARKLMPGTPEPRMNLALVLERAGRTGEALETYAAALQANPGHIESMQGLARLQLRSGKPNERTPELLKEIAMRGTSDKWKEWAARQLARAGS